MRDTKNKKLFIEYIAKPVILGLLVAAVLILAFPQFRPQTDDDVTDLMTLSQSNLGTDWIGPVSYASAVSRAAPSVVNIYTLQAARSRSDASNRISLGSGVIMQSDGLLLTNHHVIEGAVKILVLLYDGREVPATVVGTDPEIDLAVLKIEADNLTPIALGEPSQAKIGDIVLAIGNPSGIGQSVTQGIISAKGRNGLRLNIFENFIQTDAAINSGSSGGALIDAYGNLLGINTATLNDVGSTGISFAIPADAAAKVLTDITQYGHVVRGWLGISANLGLISNELGITKIFGVTSVEPGGPTAKAGLIPGDIIFKIDGLPVTDPHISINQITNVTPGQPVKLSIIRQDTVMEFTVIAGNRPLR
ncbi:MAG: PDZ domain-containing protein [Porticoccaceae bacterium]|nr:PDZ domain-containing protein [Porticoccaceae bacterium]MBT7167675.1 PDZ domain-containing protein [Porticoccaceae bacterium]MBT7965119.1 PDZ domain-containing protein [Porticoccaceae bacterium]